MYSKSTQPKASKGSVQLKISNSRVASLLTCKQAALHFTWLPDNKINRKAAETKAKLIEADITFDRFDPTLERYKPQSVLTTVTPK
jgi:hypothetical protein